VREREREREREKEREREREIKIERERVFFLRLFLLVCPSLLSSLWLHIGVESPIFP
jgi:hypothetical protein